VSRAVLTRFGSPKSPSHPDPTTSVVQPTLPVVQTSGPVAPAGFRKGSDWRGDPATAAQKDSLRLMLAQRSGEAVEALRAALNEACEAGRLTKGFASEVIEALRAIPKDPTTTDVSVVTPTSTSTPVVRVNRFAQPCADCTVWVPEEEGVLTRADDGSWEVRHRDGDCPVTEFPFPYGSYAIEVDGVMKFYQATNAGLFAQGSDMLYPVTTGAPEVVAAIAVDALEASKRFGREVGCCGRCGRSLTSEWRKIGVGPVCSSKPGWAVAS
jgi:hypothetical protein